MIIYSSNKSFEFTRKKYGLNAAHKTRRAPQLGCNSHTDQKAPNLTALLGGTIGFKYKPFTNFQASSICLLSSIERKVRIACPP